MTPEQWEESADAPRMVEAWLNGSCFWLSGPTDRRMRRAAIALHRLHNRRFYQRPPDQLPDWCRAVLKMEAAMEEGREAVDETWYPTAQWAPSALRQAAVRNHYRGHREAGKRRRVAAVLRGIVRPILSRPSLPDDVVELARTINANRNRSGTLSSVLMNQLADRVEGLGLGPAYQPVVANLRSSPAFRGWWALDLVLGRPE